jgi:hypothetical protein
MNWIHRAPRSAASRINCLNRSWVNPFVLCGREGEASA